MKKLLLTCLISFPFLLKAQITVNQSAFPVAGTTYVNATDTAYSAAITAGGVAQTWNYAGLLNARQDTSAWVAASSTPYAATFPTSTLATFSAKDSAYAYFNGNSSGFFANGFYSYATNGFIAGQSSVTFSPSYLYIPVPFTYNNTRIAYTRIQVDIDTALPYYRFIHRINQNMICDGYGSLALPSASYPNTIRIKDVETAYDTLAVDPLGLGFYVTANTSASQITYYRWLRSTNPALLLTINADSLGTTATQSSYFMSSGATGINTINKTKNIIVYPNPATEYIQFNLPETTEEGTILTIYSSDGKVIRETIISGVDAYGFYVSKMEAGSYIYTITNQRNKLQGRFVVIR